MKRVIWAATISETTRACSILREHGIRYHLPGQHFKWLFGSRHDASHGVPIYVARKRYEEARELLAEIEDTQGRKLRRRPLGRKRHLAAIGAGISVAVAYYFILAALAWRFENWNLPQAIGLGVLTYWVVRARRPTTKP